MTRKLTDNQKIEIVEKYLTGNYSCIGLGKEYSVHSSSISNILKVRKIPINNDKAFLARKYLLDEHYFDTIDDEHKAYWLGWLYSDGNIFKRSITISLQEEDKEILEKFQQDLNSNRPLEYISNFNQKDGYIRKPQWKISLTSLNMVEKLFNLGCHPKKSLTLEFPTEDQVPKHLLRHWLRGMWDGDGTFCYQTGKTYNKRVNKFYERFQLESSIVGTLNICNGIKDFILDQTGILTRVKDIKNKEVKRLKNNKIQDIYQFSLWLYSDCSIYLERKYNKCKEIETILIESHRIDTLPFFINESEA